MDLWVKYINIHPTLRNTVSKAGNLRDKEMFEYSVLVPVSVVDSSMETEKVWSLKSELLDHFNVYTEVYRVIIL